MIISEIGIPDIDGYEFVQQVRQQYPRQLGTVPAIALTTYASDSDRQQALAAGFQSHLAKPIEPDLLMQTILTLLERRLED